MVRRVGHHRQEHAVSADLTGPTIAIVVLGHSQWDYDLHFYTFVGMCGLLALPLSRMMRPSLQLGVFRLGLLEHRNVGIGVVPEGQKLVPPGLRLIPDNANRPRSRRATALTIARTMPR